MNPETTPQPSASATPRRRWPRRLALGVAITMCLLLASHLIWYLVASAELTEARAAATAAGLSQDAATVIPPPCADADNAALPYQQAYGLLTLGGKPYVPERSGGELDPRLAKLLDRLQSDKDRESVIATDAAATLQLLDHGDFARAWRLVAEGARLPRCRFDNRYEAGAAMTLPQLRMIRDIARLGGLRARLLAASGRPQEAADQLADLLWMLRQHRRDEPVLISLLVSLSAEGLVLADLRRAVEDRQLAGAGLARCSLALDDEQRATVWRQCLQGEFTLFGMWGFRSITDGSVSAQQLCSVNPGLGHAVLWRLYGSWCSAPLRAGDEALYIRLFTDLLTGRLPPGEIPAPSRWHPLTSLIFPAFGMAPRTLAMNTRLVATAQLALSAAAGQPPAAQPGIAVERGTDGSWLISPGVDADSGSTGKKLLVPWRVPADRL